MTATITDQFKRELTEELIRDFDSGDNYYIVIGRSEQWNATDTVPNISQVDYLQSPAYSRLTRNAFQASKLVSNLSYVVPRYNWTSGTIYYGYNDNHTDHDDDSKKYYVLNDQNQVYICLRSGTGGGVFTDPITGKSVPNLGISTIQPSGGLNGVPFKTSDGYFWKFLYTISVADTDNYVTSKFIPVKFVDSAGVDDPATDIQQKAVQDVANPKQIVGFQILDAGAGIYSQSALPTITIEGNGSGAAGRAIVDGTGYLVGIEIDSNGIGTDWQFGSEYDYAKVYVNGNENIARPILSPRNGIGANPTIDLRATQLMFNVQLAGNEDGEIIPYRPQTTYFRQISLLKNPTTTVNDSDYFSDPLGNNLRGMTLNSRAGGGFVVNDTITGSVSGAKAVVDHVYDSSDGVNITGFLYYHQNDSTGYEAFQLNEQVDSLIATAQGEIATFITPDIDNYSGDLLYIDSRGEIPRDTESRQDLKLVVTF
jgi:hypothetical protein